MTSKTFKLQLPPLSLKQSTGASRGFNGDAGREALPETGDHSVTAVLVPTLDLGHLAIHMTFNFLETQVQKEEGDTLVSVPSSGNTIPH